MKRTTVWQTCGGLGALALTVVAVQSAHAAASFTSESLHGTYAYTNNNDDVASFGLITFDGKDALTAAIKVNGPDTPDSRRIISLTGTGTYTVDTAGTGTATIAFKGEGVEGESIFDFVITAVAERPKGDRALATEVFAVQQTGGLHGQLVTPVWTRRGD
jgi:hypothetical protein